MTRAETYLINLGTGMSDPPVPDDDRELQKVIDEAVYTQRRVLRALGADDEFINSRYLICYPATKSEDKRPPCPVPAVMP